MRSLAPAESMAFWIVWSRGGSSVGVVGPITTAAAQVLLGDKLFGVAGNRLDEIQAFTITGPIIIIAEIPDQSQKRLAVGDGMMLLQKERTPAGVTPCPGKERRKLLGHINEIVEQRLARLFSRQP